MKKVILTIAVVSLLALAQVCWAADLQAGWYSNIRSVNIFVNTPYGPDLLGQAHFYETPPGQYGPFLVTGGAVFPDNERNVSVPESTDAWHNQSLIMPLHFGLDTGYQISYLEVSWQTNYDPAHMYLDLRRKRSDGTEELLWAQMSAGPVSGVTDVAFNNYIEGPYYFRVNTLPEPSSALALLCLLPLVRLSKAGKAG